MDRSLILGKLSPYGGRKNMIVKDQQVPDIITAMLNAHKIYANEYDKICMDFWTGNDITTAKKIFGFLKKNIKYVVDSEKNQQIMSPSSIISIGKNDCKNYSLFIMGTLDALRRKGLLKNDICYRFASYKLFDSMPHHVFAVMKTSDGDEIFIDPVLPNFNERKTYYYHIDKKPNMPLYSISGTGSQVGLFKSKKKTAAAPVTTTTTTTTAAAPKVKKKIVLKIALAPARGAFLLLVGLNFLGLATKLKNAFDQHAGKTQDWWLGLGGNPNELLRKVEQGATKKKILGESIANISEGQIGVAPAAAAAVTAAPILIKVGEFLKSLGIDPKEIVEAGKEVLAKQIKSAVDKNITAQDQQEALSDAEVNKVVDQAVEDQKSSSTNYLPYLLGGGLILVIALSKKKK